MNIVRNICGVPRGIRLTNAELKKAYNEQQRLYDHAKIRDILQQFKEEGILFDSCYLDDMAADTQFLDDVADTFYLNYDISRAEWEQMEEIIEHKLDRRYLTWARSKGVIL